MNATEALLLAQQLDARDFADRGYIEGVQELVTSINCTAIQLKQLCRTHDFNASEKKRLTPNVPIEAPPKAVASDAELDHKG